MIRKSFTEIITIKLGQPGTCNQQLKFFKKEKPCDMQGFFNKEIIFDQ